jgi:hypothetical protein
MAKDLFQIAIEKGIYLTLDSWAILSPKLVANESSKSSVKINISGSEKQDKVHISESQIDL